MTLDRKLVWNRGTSYYRGRKKNMFVCLEGHPNTKMKLTEDPARAKYYDQADGLNIYISM